MQRLRFVSELHERYHHVFPEFTTFNFIQSALMDFLMKTDISVVVSAPTGSGKTTLFEIAIIKLLEMWEHSKEDQEQKIVYMAPIKALCTEKFREWDNKFSSLGIRAIEVTGDSDGSDLLTIQHFNLILTTPEKWDALTRKWKDHSSLIQMIKLFLIDEVHLLSEETRGPTLEAVVSRMKTVQESLDSKEAGSDWIRFIAVSATIPNIEDIAAWLSLKPKAAKCFKFGEEMRPVHLQRIVKSYPCKDEKTIGYKFDLSLNYKLKQLIMQYSGGKPTLIFCSTRKSVIMTANVLCQQISFQFTSHQRENIEAAAEYLLDNKLKEMVSRGVAYHHAGLVLTDRHCIEDLFRLGYLPVLVSTSTLAMGVNLPANLVIIKSTEQYVCGGWQEYSEGQILQMVGRAGRPQFGNSATAIILTKDVYREKYEKLVHGREMIESTLHRHLVEHLNAEIVLGTITDIVVAMNWIKSTYLYVRALKNPKHYGIPVGLSSKEVEARLQDMCLRELHALESYQLILTTDMAYNVEPTENGKLMAKYYLAFETMKIFMKVKGTENLSEMLDILSQCHEFEEIQLRTNEKSILNLMNNHKEQEFIRFPLQGKVKTKQMKTNCLIQSVLGALQIGDFSLKQEAAKIIRLAQRLLNGLSLYLWQRDHYQALANTLILHKCVRARLWENSPYVCRQLPGIGSALAPLLVSANKTTFQAILESDPRDLERIINRKPPMGNQLQEAAAKIPKYEIDVSYNSRDKKILIMLKILNAFEVQYGNTLHRCSLLVADSNNCLLKKEKICDQAILAHCGEFQFHVSLRHQENVNEFIVHLISESLGAAVKQPVNCHPVNNVKPVKQIKTVKANIKGDSNKMSNVNNKKPPKDNKAKKQIQHSLEQYSFLPKRSKILRHTETLLDEENEVTSTQDIHGRSHYFSCDYEPQKNIKSAPALSTQQSDYSTYGSDMNDDICKQIDTYCISDTDDEDWSDSGISSFNKSVICGNSSKQLDPVFKKIDHIKGEPQPSHSGNSNVLLNEFKGGSKMLFKRKPIMLSPNSIFNCPTVEEPIEEKTQLNKKCFYPLFMPHNSQSLENSIEMRDVSILEPTKKSQDNKGYICPKTTVTEMCDENKENLKRATENNPVENRDIPNENCRKVDCPLALQNFEKLPNQNELLNGKTQILGEKIIVNNEHIDKRTNVEEILNEDLLLNIDSEQSLDDDISLESTDDGICKNKDNSGNDIDQNSLKDINVHNDQSCSLNEKLETRNNENELNNQCFSETSIEKKNQEQQICNNNNNIDDRNVIFEQSQNLVEEETNTINTKIHSKLHFEMISNNFAKDNKPNNNNNFKDGDKVIPAVTKNSSQNLGFDVDELLERSPKNEEKKKTVSSSSPASDMELSQFELAADDNLNLLNSQKLKNQSLFQRKQPAKNDERVNIPYQSSKDDTKIRQASRLKMISNKENLPLFINNWSKSRRFVETGTSSFNNNYKICEQEPNNELFVYQPTTSGTHVELNDVELDKCIDRICERNYLRDGYGDPFAPIYPSSALNNMTEDDDSEGQTSTVNQKQSNMAIHNESRISSNRRYEMHEADFNRSKCSQTRQTDTTNTAHCIGTPAWSLPSVSSDHHWSSNTQPFSSLNNYSLSQHRLPNFGNTERQDSTCSNRKNYGEHLFIEDPQKHKTTIIGQKSFNKLPTSQPYFKKYKPRYDARNKYFRRPPLSYCASSSRLNRSPPYMDVHQGMKNSSVLQRPESFSQRNATSAENQDYRKQFCPNQYRPVKGELFERSNYSLSRKNIPYKQPEQLSCPKTTHPSQMFASFDSANNTQYISQRGTTSLFSIDEENEGLDQFQFTTDITNSPLAEEYQPMFEPMAGNFSFPVTRNVHEMSPSPPMSGDEFQDITNQDPFFPGEEANFEHFPSTTRIHFFD